MESASSVSPPPLQLFEKSHQITNLFSGTLSTHCLLTNDQGSYVYFVMSLLTFLLLSNCQCSRKKYIVPVFHLSFYCEQENGVISLSHNASSMIFHVIVFVLFVVHLSSFYRHTHVSAFVDSVQ